MSTRIEGIIDRLTDAETFDSIKWILGEAVAENYAQAVIDAHIKANFEFQSKSGLPTSTTRNITERNACKWCKERQGRYTYGNTPSGFWDRHENCKCIITYIPVDGSTVQTLQGTGKKWEVISEEVIDERKRVGMTTQTQREITARKIVGMEQATTAELEKRQAIGMGEVGTTDPAQLKKAGGGSVEYMGKEESAHFYTSQRNVAQAIVDRFGGDIKYLENTADPSKLNWNGENWRIVRGQDFSGAIRYWKDTTDGLVFDVTGIEEMPAKTIKKRLESAINSAGVTDDIDIIVVRDGKVISTLEFKAK